MFVYVYHVLVICRQVKFPRYYVNVFLTMSFLRDKRKDPIDESQGSKENDITGSIFFLLAVTTVVYEY